MKRILFVIFALILAVSLTACTDTESDQIPQNNGSRMASSAYSIVSETATNYVRFVMEDGSYFVVELLPEYAPETVANFQALVAEHFYDGLTFHYIAKGFMIQGGDPNGDGSGFSENKIKGEFSANGFTQNTLSHTRGVISMAHGADNDSASCQFFIVHEDYTSLDGKFAAFGRVIEGMETIDAIANLEVTARPFSGEKSMPVEPPVIKNAVFVATAVAEAEDPTE